MELESNNDFLKRCVDRIATVNFIGEGSGRVYVQVSRGRFKVVDNQCFKAKLAADDFYRIFQALAPQIVTAEACAQ